MLGKARIDSVDGLPPMTISLFGSSGASAGAQRQRLDQTDDPRYHSLAKLLGPKNSQDAWHIRTAETHKMFCFLTMDFSLMRALDSQQGHELLKSLATRIMTPTEFGRYFGIAPVITPGPAEPNSKLQRRSVVPVRSDLHWPPITRIGSVLGSGCYQTAWPTIVARNSRGRKPVKKKGKKTVKQQDRQYSYRCCRNKTKGFGRIRLSRNRPSAQSNRSTCCPSAPCARPEAWTSYH